MFSHASGHEALHEIYPHVHTPSISPFIHLLLPPFPYLVPFCPQFAHCTQFAPAQNCQAAATKLHRTGRFRANKNSRNDVTSGRKDALSGRNDAFGLKKTQRRRNNSNRTNCDLHWANFRNKWKDNDY